MTGIILDSVLMLLLVAALAYGVRLEKKLTTLRAGQLAFANAVTELNQAAGRAENALVSLRQSGEEADILHDRLIKAREVKTQLEMLIARAPVGVSLPRSGEGRPERSEGQGGEVSQPVAPRVALASHIPTRTAAPSSLPMKGRENPDDDRALRMAALAERIHGMAAPAVAAPGRENVAAILGALTANQAAKQSLNQARRSLDEDLFAA
ncbi:hypothetical protein KOAAANKH_02963 [Brevundimonas sp. NIBR10]|nr:DUF6468 domain-containing protein [Brevundimonas sp. NIBR10]WGM48075.1 hypothetical protein KOAAANKH_02963 [Brevundimonas sp. NIBR10]